MIYITVFDQTHPHKQIIGFSEPAGFPSLDSAVAVMGAPFHRTPHLALYPGVAISDFAFAIDENSNNGQKYTPPQVFNEM